MTTFRIKNYKGNLVESLTNFQKKHPKERIVEAIEDEDQLKIKINETTEFNDFEKKVILAFLFGIDKDFSTMDTLEYFKNLMKILLNKKIDNSAVETTIKIMQEDFGKKYGKQLGLNPDEYEDL